MARQRKPKTEPSTDGTMPIATATPTSEVDALLARVQQTFDSLSKQHKVIARYIEQHRDQLALDGIQDVARNCDVQPSAVVRFAKQFGFSGYSEMQRLFRNVIVQQIAPAKNYQDRIRDVIQTGGSTLSSVEIAHEFLAGSIAGMQDLQRHLDADAFGRAVDLLCETESIWIAGARRSFSVAAYLDYALQHTDKRVQLVSGLGGMQSGHVRSVRAGDVLVAISFAPYAEETLSVTHAARERGARIIAITDSSMSPLARLSDVALLVQDHSTFGFRSHTSTMGLAQSLFIALAYRLELAYEPLHNTT
ncbi:MurR/RpiR family transcriptional regulator [Ralstonia syzygii subsp. celebesensis]|uniref:RpiR family transcriptional regulator n=2 Tax=Ralstonia syzygii subsp. celebesensis TaxID=1310168 RepID=A0A1U9VF17_9RALS|nr:MurR/RpiR family transcriptional regulator [Ralstonia syzygii]AQW28903.1 RpiR family transcriptional regulator [blood disease bacterium A2-HR MARDI]QQV54549.1 MurR/RpiR family transcriptional regulator [Ralstonia syzygii subsp. celebesensis]CCA79158.1 transcriptional regulator, RpiR family [blood disease bacterium R229]